MALKIQILLTLVLLLCAQLIAAAENKIKVSASADGTVQLEQAPLVLKYWDGRGLMEVARLVLAVAGSFPGDYEDGRYSNPPGGLEANLGRMPVLSMGGGEGAVTIGQSVSIHYYLAAEHGLMGSSILEAARILSVVEHVREMSAAYGALVPWGQEPGPGVTEMWLEGGADDAVGTADASRKPERYLTWWLGRMEETMDHGGFAVGGAMSLADLYLFSVLRESLSEEQGGGLPRWRREPFGELSAVTRKLAQYPRLAASCDAVSQNANVQHWLTIRGTQSF